MDFARASPHVGGVIPEDQVVDISMALITTINDAVGAVKYHKRRSTELARRVQAIWPELEEIQERGGLPQHHHGAAQNLAQSLQRAVEVMEKCRQRQRSRLLKALRYGSLKEELDEVWGDISTALADLHILGALDPRLPARFPDELHEGLEFGDAELALRRGENTAFEFVEEVLQESEVTEAEKRACHAEMAALLQQVEFMSLQHETVASPRREREALFLRQLLPLLAPLDTAGADGCQTVPPGHLCSICSSPMLDPVMTEAGHSYCRGCISQWLEKHDTDPMTRTSLPGRRVHTNVCLRQAVEAELRAMEPFASLPQKAWRAHLRRFLWEESSARSPSPLPPSRGPAPSSSQPPLAPPPPGRASLSQGEGRARGAPAGPLMPPLSHCVQTLMADSQVVSLALAPDGDVFSGHWGGSVRQWRGGVCVATLRGHTAWVRALAVAPDGSLFSGSNDKTVRQWRGGQCVAELTGHTDWVRALAAAADGTVYSGSNDKTIRQWRDGACIAELQGHTNWVTALALAADGTLFSGSNDGTIRQWLCGECVATLAVPGGQWVFALAVAPDGSLFSGGGPHSKKDWAIRQWQGGRCVATLEGHTDRVSALAAAPDGSLFSGGRDRSVGQWHDGRCVAVLEGHTRNVPALAVAPDGSLFSGSEDETIRQWR